MSNSNASLRAAIEAFEAESDTINWLIDEHAAARTDETWAAMCASSARLQPLFDEIKLQHEALPRPSWSRSVTVGVAGLVAAISSALSGSSSLVTATVAYLGATQAYRFAPDRATEAEVDQRIERIKENLEVIQQRLAAGRPGRGASVVDSESGGAGGSIA